tara:strand:- start:185 stop:967 length:783 start_codon:yes stop_codon:yes gene_type:complete
MLLKDNLVPLGPDVDSADPLEVARFNALAEEWWKADGQLKAVYKFNAARREYLFGALVQHFGRSRTAPETLSHLKVLDVGCGAGLVSEYLAEHGAKVLGIDAAECNIRMAEVHAKKSRVDVAYEHALPEHIEASGSQFDAVFAMEVVEHVANPVRFLEICCRLVSPGGVLFVATLNRTLRSFAFAIVGAEYVLGLLPRGTHSWGNFLCPDEIAAVTARCGLQRKEIVGLNYNPLRRSWSVGGDHSVNYILGAAAPRLEHA